MPQSLSRIIVHLVFSTKDRAPTIDPSLWEQLHSYLAGILSRSGCVPIQVGGVADHVHLLFALGRTKTMAQVVEALKTGSTKWLRAKGIDDFRWQVGYGAFSVDEKRREAVGEYIQNQPAHHRTLTFQDELRAILTRHGVPFDERYLWD